MSLGYSSSTKSSYILKDQISGQSPFTVSDEDWYYEASTNCVYLKEMYVPVQNEDGTYPSQAYTFDVNQAYFYKDAILSYISKLALLFS